MTPSRTWIHGWLLLLPAFALLALFTHWPVLGTIWDSFHATPKGGHPAPWVGLENYQVMVADEVFWKSTQAAARPAGAMRPDTAGGTVMGLRGGMGCSSGFCSLEERVAAAASASWARRVGSTGRR